MPHKTRTDGGSELWRPYHPGEIATPCPGHARHAVYGRTLRPCLADVLAWPLLASRGPPSCHAHDNVYLPCRGATTDVSPGRRWAPAFVCPSGFVAPSPSGSLIRGVRVAVLQLGIGNRGTEGMHRRLACLSSWLTSYLTANGSVDRRVGRRRMWVAMIFQHETETRSLEAYYIV